MGVPALYCYGINSSVYDLGLVVAAGTPSYIMSSSVWLFD